jgi:hypothetical protein
MPAAQVRAAERRHPTGRERMGLTHPADTSRSNLAAALALLSRWRLSKPLTVKVVLLSLREFNLESCDTRGYLEEGIRECFLRARGRRGAHEVRVRGGPRHPQPLLLSSACG